MGGTDDKNMRRSSAAQQMATESLNATHRVLSLAQQIAINDPSEIRSIGAVIQVRPAALGACLASDFFCVFAVLHILASTWVQSLEILLSVCL
jgi:hypothetical protein